ncbi:MAG: Yip1 family protein [bacterium]|nr:Yip1 family protein [bacterium]
MNQESPTGIEPEDHEELSKGDAMAGIFTAPGETFETITNTPKKNYWLIPVLICVAVGLIATVLFMQDAELVAKTMEKQKQKMQEQFQKSVKEGKMSQEDADKTMESMNPKGTFFKVIGFGGAAIGPFIILFILSLIYFVILKIMKSPVEFANVLNVVGLALLITAIGSIVSTVISVLKGEMSGINPALLLSEASVGEKMHSLLSKLDAFSIWFYVVISIGLSKVAKIDMIKSAAMVFGIFILYVVLTSLVF